MGAFGTEGGVVAVAGVHDGVVREDLKKAFSYVGDQLFKVFWVGSFAYATGEEAIANKEVLLAVNICRDRESSRCVPPQNGNAQSVSIKVNNVAVFKGAVYGSGKGFGIGCWCKVRRASRG